MPIVDQQDVAAAEPDLTPLDGDHELVILQTQLSVKCHRAALKPPAGSPGMAPASPNDPAVMSAIGGSAGAWAILHCHFCLSVVCGAT